MGEGQLTNYYRRQVTEQFRGWDRVIYDETASFTEAQFWYLLDRHHKRKEEAQAMKQRGHLLVLIGASGSGKSTVQARLVERGWERVVSSTTRPRRAGEVNGVDYHFYSTSEFEAIEGEGEFIETETIYGNRYGLERYSIERPLKEGKNAVVVLGIGGARQVLKLYPEATMVFLKPESRAALAERLAARGADSRRVETIDPVRVDFPVHEVINRTGLRETAVINVELAVLMDKAELGREDISSALLARLHELYQQDGPEPYGDLIPRLYQNAEQV
jgi:guanylate kinase